MITRRFLALGTASLFMILTACTPRQEPTAPEQPRVAASAPASARAQIASTPPAGGEDVDGWLADLNAIDGRIVGRHSRSTMLNRGRGVCTDLTRGVPLATVVANVNTRFTSPEADRGFGLDVARRILVVTHARLCPGQVLPDA